MFVILSLLLLKQNGPFYNFNFPNPLESLNAFFSGVWIELIDLSTKMKAGKRETHVIKSFGFW